MGCAFVYRHAAFANAARKSGRKLVLQSRYFDAVIDCSKDKVRTAPDPPVIPIYRVDIGTRCGTRERVLFQVCKSAAIGILCVVCVDSAHHIVSEGDSAHPGKRRAAFCTSSAVAG